MAAPGGRESYVPLGVLRPLGRDIWIVDGPAVRTRRLLGFRPVTTRMTVARLPDGRLWLHAPVALAAGLEAEVRALGSVAALVLPKRRCGDVVADWQAAFPGAVTWGAPGLETAAEKCGFHIDQELRGSSPSAWSGAISHLLMRGKFLTESVFLHRASRTLVVSDLIHNFDRGGRPGDFLRPVMLHRGARGGTPAGLRLAFLGRGQEVRAAVETMLGWRPDRVVLAHGRPYLRDGTAELRRALAWAGASG